MMPGKIDKRLYYARIQYRAVQRKVEAMLEQGYSLKLIFEELSESGSLSMSYTTFCDYVRGKGVRKHGRKKTVGQAGSKNHSAQAAVKPPAKIDKSTPFSVEKTRLEDLI